MVSTQQYKFLKCVGMKNLHSGPKNVLHLSHT